MNKNYKLLLGLVFSILTICLTNVYANELEVNFPSEYNYYNDFDLSSYITFSPYNETNATYSGNYISVSGQDSIPQDVYIKPDGSKMYLNGENSDSIFQYSLTTLYDISTASYDSKSCNHGQPYTRGMYISENGSKLYFVRNTNSRIYQYRLTTAWDISTCVYEKNVDTTPESWYPRGLTFSYNGSKMYTISTNSNKIYEYDLSTAWDIGTASYNSNNYANSHNGLDFSNDGLKLFTVSSTAIYQHDLTTAWDISTANYNGINLDINSETTTPSGLSFTDNGRYVYVSDYGSDRVFQYNLTHGFYLETGINICNVTINGVDTKNCTNNNYNFSSTGNQTFNISFIYTNGTTTTTSYEMLVNPFQYFRFYNTGTATYVTDYYLNSVFYNSTYASIKTYDLGLGNQSLQFSKSGFYPETFYQVINTTSDLNETFNVTPVTLTIKMYDITDDTQLYFNATILNSTDSEIYLNEFNFSKFYNETITGDIDIIISSNGYEDSKFYTILNDTTSISLTGYMFPTNETEIHTFTVTDVETGLKLNDVVVEIQTLINGSYSTIATDTTSNGQVYFNLDPDIEYLVIFTKDDYVSTTAKTIPQTVTYDVKLTPSSASYTFINGINYKFMPITSTLYSNNTYDLVGFISGAGLSTIYYSLTLNNGTVIYSSSSTNPTGTTFTYNYNLPYNTSITYIIGNITYIKDGVSNTVLKNWNVTTINNESGIQTLRNFGLTDLEEDKILRFLIMCTVSVMLLVFSVTSGYGSATLLVIPAFAFFSYINWISWIYAGVIIFVSLALYMGGRR